MWKKTILIVEDEALIAEGLQARLSVEGYEIRVAEDGQAAVEQVRKHPPDLVLLDIMLPKINGWEVCKLIRGDPKTEKIPIIMLTSLTQIKDSEKAFEAGANDYLTKPFETGRLLEKIRKFL